LEDLGDFGLAVRPKSPCKLACQFENICFKSEPHHVETGMGMQTPGYRHRPPIFPPTTSVISRRKRGFFDPLGYVIHKVFGLATDNEDNEIKSVLASLNKDNSVIINRMDMLTIVVNRS
jgi:hypothetical protein